MTKYPLHLILLHGITVLALVACFASQQESAPQQDPARPPPLPYATGVPPAMNGTLATANQAAAADGKVEPSGERQSAATPRYQPEAREVIDLKAAADDEYQVVKVLFATDRELADGQPPGFPQRGPHMRYGQCVVTLPTARPVGETAAPSQLLALLGVTSEDPEHHVMLRHFTEIEEAQFSDTLRWGFSAASAPSVLLFVHGFNVPFNDACARVAQLTHDLKFKGLPVLFSWPSQGRLQAYLQDGEEILLSQLHLRDLLLQLIRNTPGQDRQVIAHSMGARGLLNALLALPLPETDQPYFQNIVLAAADVNGQFFRQVAPHVRTYTDRLTLYASSNDQALRVSSDLHGYARLGEAGEALLVLPGMDTIDASNADTSLLGHGYYSSNAPMLADLHGLITSGLPPEQRFQLQPNDQEGQSYWEFRKLR